MKKTLISASILVFVVVWFFVSNLSERNNKPQFQNWKKEFGIIFDTLEEDIYRQNVFNQNLANIKAHNSKPERTYQQAINQFTELTQEQFVQTYLGLKLETSDRLRIQMQGEREKQNEFAYLQNLKFDVDWVARGAVTAVKDQGKCGSCWAFSTTGGLEGFHKLAYGSLQSFSEQQLVDCSSNYGNTGCNGGMISHAYSFVKDKGIVTEEEYPYVAVQQTCKIDKGAFKISGHYQIYGCNELGLSITRLPISVGVDATNWSPYKDGVFSNCSYNINHGVTLVGVRDGNWIVKNSWKTSWGQDGYMTLKAGSTCGICDMAMYPNK